MAPFTTSEQAPQWDAANFVPSQQTRAAFEVAHDAEQYELRAREGLGVSVRFPASRALLWHSEPHGLPVHVTHDTCLPSLSIPPSVLGSLRSFLTEGAGAVAQQLEFVGEVATVDHQLAFSNSVTRGKLQVVLNMLQSAQADYTTHRGGLSDGCRSDGDGKLRVALMLRAQHADDAEMLSADEQRANVLTISDSLQERRRLTSALNFVQLSLLCAQTSGKTLTLVCQATVPCVSFMLTPLRLLKVIPTSLSQALYERVNIGSENSPATGFLSMDQARRLLLIPELDPKARQVPLVGLWVSGVDSIADAFVWAAIVRYLQCADVGEKVTCHDGAFLCLFYHRTALRQPPALLQVRVHSGDMMFAHAGSYPLVLPLAPETGESDALLEFDQKRVSYSYAPGYDKLTEVMARERNASEGSMDLPRCAIPQPAPAPPAAPQNLTEDSMCSGRYKSERSFSSSHSVPMSHPTSVFGIPRQLGEGCVDSGYSRMPQTVHNGVKTGDELNRPATSEGGSFRSQISDPEGSGNVFGEYLKPQGFGDGQPTGWGGGGANFMMAATVRSVEMPIPDRHNAFATAVARMSGEFDFGQASVRSSRESSSGRATGIVVPAAKRRLQTDSCDAAHAQERHGHHDEEMRHVAPGRGWIRDVFEERRSPSPSTGAWKNQIEAQQKQISELVNLVEALQRQISISANGNPPANGMNENLGTASHPKLATSTMGTQLNSNASLFTNATTSLVPEAELLLPESPSVVTTTADEIMRNERAMAHVGNTKSPGAVQSGIGRNVQVFADTLGMHTDTWGASVSEVLHSTFPPARQANDRMPVRASTTSQSGGEWAGGSDATGDNSTGSPEKTRASPQKAPKAPNADRAAADPGVGAQETTSVAAPREGAEKVTAVDDRQEVAERSPPRANTTSRSSGGSLSPSADFGTRISAVSGRKQFCADFSGVVSIDHVNSPIVRANIRPLSDSDSDDSGESGGLRSSNLSRKALTHDGISGPSQVGSSPILARGGISMVDDLERKYLSSSLIAKIAGGDDIVINGRKL